VAPAALVMLASMAAMAALVAMRPRQQRQARQMFQATERQVRQALVEMGVLVERRAPVGRQAPVVQAEILRQTLWSLTSPTRRLHPMPQAAMAAHQQLVQVATVVARMFKVSLSPLKTSPSRVLPQVEMAEMVLAAAAAMVTLLRSPAVGHFQHFLEFQQTAARSQS
jgi:hypothetical protein